MKRKQPDLHTKRKEQEVILRKNGFRKIMTCEDCALLTDYGECKVANMARIQEPYMYTCDKVELIIGDDY